MIELPKGVDQTTFSQKVIAVGIVGASLMLGWWLLPPLIVILTNLWIAVFLLIPVGFVAYNPRLIWGVAKTISWKITQGLISLDPLAAMDRYGDYLAHRLEAMDKARTQVRAAAIRDAKEVRELEKSIESNGKLGAAALREGKATIAETYGFRVQTDEESLVVLKPAAQQLELEADRLDEMYETHSGKLENLRYLVGQKRKEHDNMLARHKAMGAAREFTNGESEAGKAFQESVRQLEAKVTTFAAEIDNFEKKTRPMLEAANLERDVATKEGLKSLERFK